MQHNKYQLGFTSKVTGKPLPFNSSVMICKPISERSQSYTFKDRNYLTSFVDALVIKFRQQKTKFYIVNGEDYNSEKGRYYYSKIYLIRNKDKANKHVKLWI